MFKEGVLVALFNPKMIVFYIVIWPSFLDNTKSIAVQGVALTITLVFWLIISLIVTMFIVAVGRKRYITENRLMFVNKIMSVAFIVIAISIVYKA